MDRGGSHIDLNGCSYAERTSSGSTEVVTAGTNVNGIRLALAGVVAWSGACNVAVGGEVILYGFAAGTIGNPVTIQNVLVPPDVQLSIMTAGISGRAWVWYEVL